MVNRNRNVKLEFWVTERERDMIAEKMALYGTGNMSAYLRKIAIDGYVVKLDLPELKEMVSLLRRSSNNLNQLAKRMNETGRVYETDIQDVVENQERLWQAASDILRALSKIQ